MNCNMPILGSALRSVLVLDDEVIVLMMIEDMLCDLGAKQIHAFTDPAKALAVAQEAQLDCAVLDVMMRGTARYEVAEVLNRRHIPFVFSSGVDAAELDPRFRDVILLNKPFSDWQFSQSLVQAMGLAISPEDTSRPHSATNPSSDQEIS